MGLAANHRLAYFDTADGNRLPVTPQLRTENIPTGAVTASKLGKVLSRSHAPGTRIVWYGDSYIYSAGGQEYTDSTSRNALGSAMWCEALLLGRLRPLANEGAGGESTASFLARVGDVTAQNPDIVGLLTSGINDVKGAVSSATTIANLTAIFDAINNAGAIVICGTVPPSDLMDTAGEIENLFAVNRWLMAEAHRRTGLIVVDLFPVLALQSASVIDWRTEYDYDGTHPAVRGCHKIGQLFAQALDKIIPGDASPIIRHDLDPEELLPNPCLTGTGGTGSGVIPASVTSAGGTGTGSKVARTDDLPGDWFRWAQTAGTNDIYQAATSGFTTGQRLVARVELNCTSTPSSPDYYVYCEQRDGSSAVVGTSVLTNLTETGHTAPTHGHIIVQLNPIVVHASAASIRVGVRSTNTANLDIGLMSLREVDA